MGVRYTALAYSNINDTPYTIGIYDSSFSGTVQQIELSGDAFSIEYERQGDEKFTAVKGSRCNVFLKVTDDAVGLDLQSWITTNLLASNEDKFQLVVYRDGNLFWVGNILHDLSGRMDASRPYDFTLTATDGLARLKDFTFDFATDNNDRYKMIDYIFEVLKETPLYKLNISSYLYTTCVEWWEDSMPARAANKDPLDFTKVHCYTFTKFDEKKQERTAFTYYEVLEELCKHWGMRVIMSEGIYKFVQVNNYVDDGTTKYQRVYNRSNAYVSNSALPSALNIQTSSPIRKVMAGNQWNYFAPLKNVYRTFPFTNKNMLNGGTDLPYSQNLPSNLTGGAGKKLILNMGIDWQITGSVPLGSSVKIDLRIEINLDGQYWLKGNSATGAYSWETTLSYVDYSFVRTGVVVANPSVITFVTPEIPSGTFTTNTFDVEVTGASLVTTGASLTYTAARIAATSSLIYNTATLGANQTGYKYQVQNTGLTVINSYDIDLGEAIFGEAYFAQYFGGLYVYNGTTYVPSTGIWRIYDTGTDNDFIQTILFEVMAAQILPVPKYQGAIIGSSILPDSGIVYNSETYILNGGSFNAGTETWEGEWFKVSTDRASVYEIENATGESDGSNTDFIRAIGGLEGGFSPLANLFYLGNLPMEVISADTDIYPFTQNLFVDTDEVNLYLPAAANWIYQGRTCEITVKNICSGASDIVNIYPDGTETIDGDNVVVLSKLHAATIISDGTNLYLKTTHTAT